MENTAQAKLLPLLWASLGGKPQQHQDSLLFISLPAITHVNLSTESMKLPFAFLKEQKNLGKYISEFLLDMLILPYG